MTGKGPGGARPGAGRKPGKTASATEQYNSARARKEAALADLREMESKERARELIPAEEVQTVVATAFSAIAQALRSLPDNLERRAGIGPQALEEVEKVLDAEMTSLADALSTLAMEKPADHRAALEWIEAALARSDG